MVAVLRHALRSRARCTTSRRRLSGRANRRRARRASSMDLRNRRLASSTVVAVASPLRGRKWRPAKRPRHIRRARRGLKCAVVVVASRAARMVAADGRSPRDAAETSTAGDKHATGARRA